MTDDEPFRLAAMAGRPRRSRALITTIASLAVLVVALGVTSAVLLTRKPDGQAAADTPPSPGSSPRSPAPTASQPAQWQNGCLEVGLAIDSGLPLDPQRMQTFGQMAVDAPIFEVRFAGQMLADRAELAAASQGQADAEKYATGMRTAAGKLRIACMAAGYPPN